jgi:AraC-like DNA-binding protein
MMAGMLIASLLVSLNLLIMLQKERGAQFVFIIAFPLLYTIYPILNIYINSIVEKGKKVRIPISHFVLPIFVFISLFLLLVVLGDEFGTIVPLMNSYKFNQSYNLRVFFWIIYLLYYVQFFYYLFSFIKLNKRLKMNFQNSFESVWVKYVIIGIIVYEILFFISWMQKSETILIDIILSDLVILVLGLVGLKHDELLLELQISKSFENNPMLSSERKIKSKFSEGKKHEIISELQDIIKNEKLYLNPNLKIKNFAKRLHLPEKDLSIIINDSIGKNFSSFINEYRINAACLLLSDTNVKISNIPSQVGFFSRSAFNKIFKEIIGQTPSEYRKSA